jgi:hypothetical protein
MPRRDVVPPVPGRDADPPGDVVRAVDRATLVTAGDDERAADPRQRVVHDLLQGGLPLPRDATDVEPACGDQPVDEPAVAEGAHEHDVPGVRDVAGGHGGPYAGDPLHVGTQVADRPDHAGMVLTVHDQRRRPAARDEREPARPGGAGDVVVRGGGGGVLAGLCSGAYRHRDPGGGRDEQRDQQAEQARGDPAGRVHLVSSNARGWPAVTLRNIS